MDTSFKQLYLQYYAPAKRFATLYVKRSDVAEDVVQDVFLKIYELQKRAPQCNFSMAYVMTSVKHGCISFLRGELLITELEGNYSEVERSEMQWMCNQLEMWDLTTSVTEDTISEIYKAIDALPPQCREIFFRSKIEGKKHQHHRDSDVYCLSKIAQKFRAFLVDSFAFRSSFLVYPILILMPLLVKGRAVAVQKNCFCALIAMLFTNNSTAFVG